jgi:hypothetical protein
MRRVAVSNNGVARQHKYGSPLAVLFEPLLATDVGSTVGASRSRPDRVTHRPDHISCGKALE